MTTPRLHATAHSAREGLPEPVAEGGPGHDVAPEDGDELFDTANLSEARTGMPGFIFISTRMAQDGPRVKYFSKLGPDQPSFSVTIADKPAVVANSLPERVVRRMSPRVIQWVQLTDVALLQFWNEGAYWTKEQVDEHLNNLKRLV